MNNLKNFTDKLQHFGRTPRDVSRDLQISPDRLANILTGNVNEPEGFRQRLDRLFLRYGSESRARDVRFTSRVMG